MHYTTLHMNYILTRNSGWPTAPRRSFVAGPVPQLPAVQAALHDDPLQRIVMTGAAIRRGPQALLRHMSVLEDMMARALASMDSDIQDPRPAPQLNSAYRRRLKQAAQEFPRSVAEFYCAYSYADISAAKGNTFLGMAVNQKFSPHDLSEFTSVQTMESKIMKFLFPEGHKIKDLTRQRDGKRMVLQ